MSQQYTVPDNFFISPTEAARLLDIPVRGLDALQQEGKLINVKTTPGGHRRYNAQEILSLYEDSNGGDSE